MLFKRSGYKSIHWDKGHLAEDIARKYETGERPLADWDDTVLFSDMESVHKDNAPIEGYAYFAYLEEHYPDAKFILNTRDVNAWLASRMLHREGKYFRYFVRHYGSNDPIEIMRRWKQSWEEHHEKVRAHFADKPGKLVEFKLGVDDGEKLRAFFAPEIQLNLAHWGNETKRIRRRARRPPGDRPSTSLYERSL